MITEDLLMGNILSEIGAEISIGSNGNISMGITYNNRSCYSRTVYGQSSEEDFNRLLQNHKQLDDYRNAIKRIGDNASVLDTDRNLGRECSNIMNNQSTIFSNTKNSQDEWFDPIHGLCRSDLETASKFKRRWPSETKRNQDRNISTLGTGRYRSRVSRYSLVPFNIKRLCNRKMSRLETAYSQNMSGLELKRYIKAQIELDDLAKNSCAYMPITYRPILIPPTPERKRYYEMLRLEREHGQNISKSEEIEQLRKIRNEDDAIAKNTRAYSRYRSRCEKYAIIGLAMALKEKRMIDELIYGSSCDFNRNLPRVNMFMSGYISPCDVRNDSLLNRFSTTTLEYIHPYAVPIILNEFLPAALSIYGVAVPIAMPVIFLTNNSIKYGMYWERVRAEKSREEHNDKIDIDRSNYYLSPYFYETTFLMDANVDFTYRDIQRLEEKGKYAIKSGYGLEKTKTFDLITSSTREMAADYVLKEFTGSIKKKLKDVMKVGCGVKETKTFDLKRKIIFNIAEDYIENHAVEYIKPLVKEKMVSRDSQKPDVSDIVEKVSQATMAANLRQSLKLFQDMSSIPDDPASFSSRAKKESPGNDLYGPVVPKK